MKSPRILFRATLLMAILALATAQAGAQPAAAAPEKLGKPAENRIYAQQLVNEMLAANPDLLDVGLHAIRPGGTDLYIIADGLDIIGRKDAPNNLEMMNRDQTILEPRLLGKTPRMAVHTPLRNSAGDIVGLAVFSFKRGDGMDKLTAYVRSATLLAQLAKKVPDTASLFQPVP
ncbi:MAG: hypothetical protein JWM88_2236 [Verrucomicrobia bacterium]|nr:hypothetical protein [Verrucomicrobiota bacterium]